MSEWEEYQQEESELELALTEYMNIPRPKSKDKTFAEMKHWAPVAKHAKRYAQIQVPASIHGLLLVEGVPPEHVQLAKKIAAVVAAVMPHPDSSVRIIKPHMVPRIAAALTMATLTYAGIPFERVGYIRAGAEKPRWYSKELLETEYYGKTAKRLAPTILEEVERLPNVPPEIIPIAKRLVLYYTREELKDVYKPDIEAMAAKGMTEVAMAVPIAREYYEEFKRLSELGKRVYVEYAERLKEIENLVKELYSKGYTYQQIMQKIGLSSGFIYRVLHGKTMPQLRKEVQKTREEGRVSSKYGKRLTPHEEEMIVKLRRQGLSIPEIARRVGRSVGTVHRVLKKYGLAGGREKKRGGALPA